MKKKNYLGIIIVFMMLLGNYSSYSQSWCLDTARSIDPIPEQLFNDYVKWFKARGGQLNTDLKVIPTVIHVIYRNARERLLMPRFRVYGQIEATNKQLRRLNANANETRPEFLPAATDCNIQVALATRKPDGSRFDGIVYHYLPGYEFNNLDAIRLATTLDYKRYMNVWVLPDRDNGEAVFPWQASTSHDGFFIASRIFGIKGSNLLPGRDEGTTFTHELGHYLGLWHTFQSSSGYIGRCDLASNDSLGDNCSDTPLDWFEHFVGAYPDTCRDGIYECFDPPGAMYMTQTENYMFYNKDSCQNMFSKDQRARMRAALFGFGYRRQLSSFLNLLYTGVKPIDLRRDGNYYSQVSALPEENNLVSEKASPKNDITIFPNPAKSNVHITYSNPAIKNMSLKVYNQTGVKLKEVYSKTPVYELNLDGLPDGIYYINMTIDNEPVTKRIIKTGSGRTSSAQ